MSNELLAMLQDVLPSWRDLWDNELSLFENYKSITRQAVILPDEEKQIDVATMLILVNSKACLDACPIGFFVGAKGSGKSTLALLANKTRGYSQVFGPADTFAALRNEINRRKWADYEIKLAQGDRDFEVEKDGYFVAWDNLNGDTLKNNQALYSSLLLQGAYRSTGVAQIAQPGGENMVFNVFGLKLLTTVNFYIKDPWFEELRDRCIPILFARNDDSANTLISLESYNWERFEDLYLNFWASVPGRLRFRDAFSHVARLQAKSPMKGRRWHMSAPLMISYCVYSYGDVGDLSNKAHELLKDYWAWLDGAIGRKSLNAEVLGAWLENSQELSSIRMMGKAKGLPGISIQLNGEIVGYPPEISAEIIQGFIERNRRTGCLDIDRMTHQTVSQLMGELGYRKISVDGQATWMINAS